MRTVPATPASAEARCRSAAASAAARRSASVGLGVEPGLGLLDQPAQLRRADRVRERRDLGVHERRRRRGQAQGAVGDEREPPRRQLTGLEPGPAAREPVAALDRVGQVAAPGLGGAAHRGGELDRPRTPPPPGTPRPPSGRPDSCHSSTGPTSESAECIDAHRAAALHHLAGRVVLDLLLGPRVRQHRGGVVGSRERERVEGRGHRGTNSATDHRHSPGPDHPCGQGIGRLAVQEVAPALAARFRDVAARPTVDRGAAGRPTHSGTEPRHARNPTRCAGAAISTSPTSGAQPGARACADGFAHLGLSRARPRAHRRRHRWRAARADAGGAGRGAGDPAAAAGRGGGCLGGAGHPRHDRRRLPRPRDAAEGHQRGAGRHLRPRARADRAPARAGRGRASPYGRARRRWSTPRTRR